MVKVARKRSNLQRAPRQLTSSSVPAEILERELRSQLATHTSKREGTSATDARGAATGERREEAENARAELGKGLIERDIPRWRVARAAHGRGGKRSRSPSRAPMVHAGGLSYP